MEGGSPEFLKRIAQLKLGGGAGGHGRPAGRGHGALISSDFPGETAEVVAADGVASLAAVPMKLGASCWECWSWQRAERPVLLAGGQPSECRRASQVAMAVENALLFKDLQGKTGELAEQNADLAKATEDPPSDRFCREGSAVFQSALIIRASPNAGRSRTAFSRLPILQVENLRCWQVAGTHCGGEVQGVFAQKFGRCEKCEVLYRI